MSSTIHGGYLPGAMGRIIELHGTYYHRHSGFGVYFESKVASELAAFCANYDETRDGLWLAIADDQQIRVWRGQIFIFDRMQILGSEFKLYMTTKGDRKLYH